jgi:hypothetical protein
MRFESVSSFKGSAGSGRISAHLGVAPAVRKLGKGKTLTGNASRAWRLIDTARQENLQNPFRTETS